MSSIDLRVTFPSACLLQKVDSMMLASKIPFSVACGGKVSSPFLPVSSRYPSAIKTIRNLSLKSFHCRVFPFFL
jgi:hypothetical protein